MVKCSVPKCERDALLIVMTQPICGDCYSLYYEETQRQKMNEIKEVIAKNGSSENSGN